MVVRPPELLAVRVATDAAVRAVARQTEVTRQPEQVVAAVAAAVAVASLAG